MYFNFIIIGQGITGTFLSYYLQKNNLSFIIIDESKTNTASKAAAGIINPITGRRLVKTWMISELMNFAKIFYGKIEKELNINCIAETKIIDFFPTPQMRNAFLKRFEEDPEYLKLPTNENDQRENLNYDFGYGEIEPVLLININELLAAFRKKLLNENLLLEEYFDINELKVSENKIQYKNISADKIVFCDGIESFSNPYFKDLPFAPNKGEALIAEIKNFSSTYIFKKGINIVPWKENLFWVGSSYQWEFSDDKPTESFRKQTESILRNWIKTDLKIIEHFASVRPATLERRPFVGFHPIYKNVGILNGMGTKGCSLAPFFADQFVDHIVNGSPLNADANINRFDKILSRK
ncbi:MAG TPA: FAD-dependent oxidoreductase [Puia sp.]|jgi:glycine/D-amino acid oxidase-like deaminating enzyme|nr:FAD-dependent oxidoreductase [Puia sp.]